MSSPASPRESRTLTIVRRALLAIVAFGTLGMCVELYLLGHHAGANQLIPLVVAGAALPVTLWVSIRPGVLTLRTMQFLMLTFIGTGLLGITFHFQANAELQRESDPSISIRDLAWKAATTTGPPALAPGLMVQLGCLGLVFTYRHPALGDEDFGDDA